MTFDQLKLLSFTHSAIYLTLLAVWIIPVVVVHMWWLPKHGVNGWTGEPKDKYYALRGWDR